MGLTDLPNEVLHDILKFAAQANERAGVTFTFGLARPPLTNENRVDKYVRGPVPPTLLKWDSTTAIRNVCRDWHEWGLAYVFKEIYVRRWRGDERWCELSLQRDRYGIYEMIEAPRGERVFRAPHKTLIKTREFFKEMPQFATNVRRLWFDGLYLPETDSQIIDIMHSCNYLISVTLPWTLLRHGSARDWTQILGTRREIPLNTLELHAIQLPISQAEKVSHAKNLHPLESRMVDFSRLTRLKLFGDTQTHPIHDEDLKAIARTATHLEDFQITCMSTVTLNGVMAIVKASRNTLRVLEHSPRAQDGFSHPHPGVYSEDEHLCDILTSCPKLEDLSISVPSMCASLFSNDRVLWRGDCQVRALHLCGHEEDSASNSSVLAMRSLLSQARRLISRRALQRFPAQLTIELFFGDLIFDPHMECVHGDFSLAEMVSHQTWPGRKVVSRKGPYGTTGLYGKREEEHPYDRIREDDFLEGIARGLISL